MWHTGMPSFAAARAPAKGRVDVARHDHEARLVLDERPLERHQRPGGLLGVGARADVQFHVRHGQAEVVEEDVLQHRVVVLTGVDEELRHSRRRERSVDRSHLHVVRTRADDVKDGGARRESRFRPGLRRAGVWFSPRLGQRVRAARPADGGPPRCGSRRPGPRSHETKLLRMKNFWPSHCSAGSARLAAIAGWFRRKSLPEMPRLRR